MLPDNPAVSLTHGDLWRGNVVDGRWVIDPEVSFADRELDLACMRMSEEHPLPTEFWAAYQQAWPIHRTSRLAAESWACTTDSFRCATSATPS